MKKWLATMLTCLMLLLVSSGAALAHDRHYDRHGHHFRHHHFDHHRHWRHHDGRIIIRANVDDNVYVEWAVPR